MSDQSLNDHELLLAKLVHRRCAQLGVNEVITPLVLAELRRLQEGKAISHSKKTGKDSKQKQTQINDIQSQRGFKTAQRVHAKEAAKILDQKLVGFQRALLSSVYAYKREEIPFRKLKTLASDAFIQYTEICFKLGTKAAGLIKPTGAFYDLTSSEKKWLASYKKEEFKHFEKFLQEVKAGLNKEQISRRIGLYATALHSVYESGRVLAFGNDVLITWVLESDKPCPDCIELSKHNPYTTKTLPTTPKAGATRCRSHCYCSLKITKATPEEIKEIDKKHIKPAALLKKMKQSLKKKKKK